MSSKTPDIPPPTGGSVPQAPPPVAPPSVGAPSAPSSASPTPSMSAPVSPSAGNPTPEAYSPTWQGGGPARTSHRELIQLPVGFELPNGELAREAEVRAVTGADELFIGQSSQYNRHPNDLVYRTLLLSRTVTRIGPHKNVTVNDVGKMHALDVRALEYAVYRLTYGEENLPEEEPGPGGVTVAYPLPRVREETAFLAYHMHWSLHEILELPHKERVEWVGQVSKINKKILEAMK